MKHVQYLGCVFSVLLAACVDRQVTSDFTVEDSSGVAIAVSLRPSWSGGGGGWTLESRPVVEIRDDPAVPEQTLFGVSDVVMLTDRRVVAANSRFSQLLVFDSAGTFLEVWGRRGEGPGEFTSLRGLWRCSADTLVALDRGRVNIFDSRGAFARTETVVGRLTPSGAFELEGVAGDCTSVLLAVRHARPPSGFEERRTFRYPTEVFWARLDGSGQVPIDSFPGNELFTVNVNGTLVGAQLPFSVQPVWGTDGQRVVYGPADRYEVQLFGATGRLERVVRWQASPQPISEDDWARYERWRLANLEGDEPDPAATLIPTRADHPSELRPTYSDLLVDDDGNLWVRAYVDRFLDVEEPPPAAMDCLRRRGPLARRSDHARQVFPERSRTRFRDRGRA